MRAFNFFSLITALMPPYVLHSVEREWFLAEAFIMFYWWRYLYCKGRGRKTCTQGSGDVIAQYIKMYDTRELVGWLSMWREQRWINIETSLWNINTNNESNWGIKEWPKRPQGIHFQLQQAVYSLSCIFHWGVNRSNFFEAFQMNCFTL